MTQLSDAEIAELLKRHERDEERDLDCAFSSWCDPECEGRCRVCPADHRRELHKDRASLLNHIAAAKAQRDDAPVMPEPDALVKNANGYECAAMFYYGMPEDSDATAIARENGFEICFVMAEDVLSEDDPRMVAYDEAGDCDWCFGWRPDPPTFRGGGWKWAGNCNTDDGPCASFLRPLPPSPQEKAVQCLRP